MDILEDVKMRLISFGYNVDETEGSIDLYIINHMINKVTNHIKNSCNISSIPEGLYEVAIDMVCGNFLKEKKIMDADSLSHINLEFGIKSIKEGDTQVEYAVSQDSSSTPDAKFDAFVQYLIEHGEKDFVTYRDFSW